MLSDCSTCYFQKPATLSEGLSPLLQQKSPMDVGGPLFGVEGGETAVTDRLTSTNDALRYNTYPVFDCFHSLMLNFNPYSEDEE